MEEYRKAIATHPGYTAAYHRLGTDLEKIGKEDEAISQYLKLLDIYPKDVDVAYKVAILYCRQKRNDDFLKKINSKASEVYNNIGCGFCRLGRIDEAIKLFQQALLIRPNYEEVYNNLGTAFFQKGDLKGAITCFRKAFQIDPKFIAAKKNLQKVLMLSQIK